MRGYFGFECLGIGGADRSLVVFCSSRAPNEVDLREQISTFCDNNKVPDAIFVVSPQSVTGDLKQACAALESKLASATRYRNPPALYVVTFDDLGSLQPMPGTVIPPHIDRRRMIRQGMTDIFLRRHGMLQGDRYHHFRKPSGKHSNNFMRAGSVLVDGAGECPAPC